MKWYDFFANIYDSSLEKLYFQSRVRSIELLDLQPGQSLLDVACGTGANFQHIQSEQNDLQIFGTDFSEGMLRKSRRLIEEKEWSNITIFKADARQLSSELIKQKTGFELQFDRIICVLGLSVMPDWEAVMDNMIGLLKVGGKIVIMDVYAENRNFYTWMVEKIAKADLDRKIWQILQRKTRIFHHEYLPVPENKVGGKLFVAVGEK